MKKIMEVINRRWLLMVMMCFISLSAVSVSGCAGSTKSSTVTTTTNEASGGGETTSVTTRKETETSAHPRGVLGGIFYTIGQVLIFPFKLIGSLF